MVFSCVKYGNSIYSLSRETKEAEVTYDEVTNTVYSGSVVIPETITLNDTTYTVTSIGLKAFSGCEDLTAITIPSTVISIKEDAFNGCEDLTRTGISSLEAWCKINFGSYGNPLKYAAHLYLNGEELINLTIPEGIESVNAYAFDGLSSIKSVTVSSTVKTIDGYAFRNCKALTSVTLGKSLTYIESLAFRSCSKLDTLICYADEVPFANYLAFQNTYKATLFVPEASLEAYKAADEWSKFSQILPIESISTGMQSIARKENIHRTYDIFDLNGHRVSKLQKGVNIVKYASGTAKKIIK